MLGLKFIRTHSEAVKEALSRRNNSFNLDEVLAWDEAYRSRLGESEKLKNLRNSLSEEIGRMNARKQDAAAQMQEVRDASARIREIDQDVQDLEQKINQALLMIPNIPHASVPVGPDEDANVVVRVEGEPPGFDFQPRNHWEIGEDLDILDFARGVKIAGARFTVLKGKGAQLERAITNFMLDLHTREQGYTEIFPPFLVNRATMTGTGQLPKFEEDLFRCDREDLFLIPTAEVPVTNLYREEILPGEALPILHTAYTACFRAEAGAAGRDTRGLIRQHQFNKVELVEFTAILHGVGAAHRRRGRGAAPVGTGLPGSRPIHRRPGLLRCQDLRPGGLAARSRRLPGDLFLQQLRGLPGPAGKHSLPAGGRCTAAVRAHPERLRVGGWPHPGGNPGKLPAGGRLGDRSGGIAPILRLRPDRITGESP